MPQPKNPLQLHIATPLSVKTTKKSAHCSVVFIDEDKNILAASLLDSDKFEQAHALITDSHFQGKLAEHVMAYAAGILWQLVVEQHQPFDARLRLDRQRVQGRLDGAAKSNLLRANFYLAQLLALAGCQVFISA